LVTNEGINKVLSVKRDNLIEYVTNVTSIFSQFAISLRDLCTHFKNEADIATPVTKIIHSLQEMNKFHTILLDQASRTILKSLNDLIKKYATFFGIFFDKGILNRLCSDYSRDIKAIKDSKHHFEKISNEYDACVIRNSQTSKNKLQEAEDCLNMLSATRSGFQYETLNYMQSISTVNSRKKHEILGTVSFNIYQQNT
jgi:Arf-GAP with coiled-coil, ANK repeat and PH domain-containing protein